MTTQARLKELFYYHPESGDFVRRVATNNRDRAGEQAGSRDSRGYMALSVGGRTYKAHRLAFLYMTGKWPVNQVDHVDCAPGNNSWNNLREATQTQNKANGTVYQNSKSGLKGVRFEGTKWCAKIWSGKKSKYLGRFDTAEEASAAFIAAARERHGEFARL